MHTLSMYVHSFASTQHYLQPHVVFSLHDHITMILLEATPSNNTVHCSLEWIVTAAN